MECAMKHAGAPPHIVHLVVIATMGVATGADYRSRPHGTGSASYKFYVVKVVLPRTL